MNKFQIDVTLFKNFFSLIILVFQVLTTILVENVSANSQSLC